MIWKPSFHSGVSLLLSFIMISFEPLNTQNTTPHSDNFFKPTPLGDIALGDTIYIDVARAIDVKFEHANTSNRTFLYPNLNSSGLQVHSRPSSLSISLPEFHGCRKIIYLDEEVCYLSCVDGTVLVDLKTRKDIGHTPFECYFVLPDWLTGDFSGKADASSKDLNISRLASLACEHDAEKHSYRIVDVTEFTTKDESGVPKSKIELQSRLWSDFGCQNPNDCTSLSILHSSTTDILFWRAPENKQTKRTTEAIGTATVDFFYLSTAHKSHKPVVLQLHLADLKEAVLKAVTDAQKRGILAGILTIDHVQHIDVVRIEELNEFVLFLSVVTNHATKLGTCEFIVVEAHVSIPDLTTPKKDGSNPLVDKQTLRVVDALSTNKVCTGSGVLSKSVRVNKVDKSTKSEVMVNLITNTVVDKVKPAADMLSASNTSKDYMRASHEGLFNLTISYQDDAEKPFGDKDRRSNLSLRGNTSLLHPSVNKSKPAELGVIKMQGKMLVWGRVGQGTTGHMVWVEGIGNASSTKIWYGETADQAFLPSKGLLYAVRDNIDVDGKTGSELLVFEEDAAPYLTLDTITLTVPKSEIVVDPTPQNITLKLPYILNEKAVEDTFELRLLDQWDVLRKLEHDDEVIEKLPNGQTKPKVFPTIPIRKNHWTQIPFDNEMMQGPYTNSAVDGSWRFFFRNTMQIVVVDEKGIFLPADKITAVDVDLVLERTADQSYRLRLCMPIMLENIKLVCKEPHLSIEIKGQIQQVFRTGTFVIIQHTVVKKPEAKDQQAPQHAVSIIDTTNWSLQNYQLPSCAASANASSFSMSVFGNIVFYAVICQDLTVQVYDFHLKGKTAKANLKMTFNNTRDSVPHIFCPSRIHLRKDRELKLAIFDQCPHHNDGVFSDIFVTGWKRGNDFRQVRSFTRHTPGSEIGRICAHRGSIVAVQDSRLFVFRDDVEFLSSRISLPEVEEHGIKTIHCLDHGRILVESPKLVVLLDLNNIHGDRYHPYRKIDISKYAFAQGGIQHVFEDPEGLLIHFGALSAADGKFPVLALQFEAPEVFIKHKEQESVPEAVAVTFEDKRNPKVQRAITFHYKAEFSKEDHREPAVSLKDPSKKIFLQAGKLLKLFSDPLIKTQGEFWEVQVQSDTKALQGSLGLEIKPAVTLAQTPANGVSSFAHSRGVIIYTTVSEDRTSIFSYIDSHEELQLEKSEGTYCIDSAMGHKESTDAGKTDSWAAVFACFNLHSSYLYFVNGGHADVRMIEVDGYILDPRIEMTSESEVYLFGMLPHRDTLYGYYSENVMQINKTAFNMFLNLSYGRLLSLSSTRLRGVQI